MYKRVGATLFGFALLLGSSLQPASAADDVSFGNVIDGVAFTGFKLVKFGIGASIGLPIAMTRKSMHNTGKTAEAVTGKTDNGPLVVAAEAVLLPVGVFTGSLEGIAYGASNSWKNADHDKPFNKETFSLGNE
jgi:hypothetical protein